MTVFLAALLIKAAEAIARVRQLDASLHAAAVAVSMLSVLCKHILPSCQH
jgi:hypothetical protein